MVRIMPHVKPHDPRSYDHIRKYPWPDIAAGKVVTLTRGIDFTVAFSTLDAMARNAARYRGMKARVRRNGDKVTIKFYRKQGK
jgi:hypothetical protein